MNIKEAINDAIFQVMGVTSDQYKTKTKGASVVNARAMYVYHATQIFTIDEVMQDIDVDYPATIYKYIRMYNQKYKDVPLFKTAADKVNQLINTY